MGFKVPFVDLPLHHQKLEKEFMEVIKDVLFNRADIIMRSDLKEFEEKVAEFIGTQYAIGLNSGTDAIFLSLLSAGVGKGDEVITVAHTFPATVAAIVFTGATPILVDIGKDYNMNTDLLEEAITSKTKAIIPVHLNGRICNMEKIMSIVGENSLIVIEDACQAWGAAFNGKKAGSIGLTGCFSLYPFKVLGGIGDGGILTTNSKEIADKISLLRDHCANRKTGEFLGFGYNSRLDNFNAAILNIKIKYLPRWVERRREVARFYHEGLKDLNRILLPPPPDSDSQYFDVFQNYVIRSNERERLISYLAENGVETLISWPIPLHHQRDLNLGHFNLPVTERISKEVVSLPINTEISEKQVEYVIQTVRNFFNKAR
mgnify:CR=1 FL=1|jgi:dTDP-4-amino-4,6-dideoxygalactose transaminase